MIRVTVDTNVLASGILGLTRPDSTPGELYRQWRAGAFRLVTSAPLVDELIRTLAQPFFRARIAATDIAESVALLGHFVIPLTRAVQGVATHPEDDLVIATALSAGVAHVVTGDRQLARLRLYEGVSFVSPREFLERVLTEGSSS